MPWDRNTRRIRKACAPATTAPAAASAANSRLPTTPAVVSPLAARHASDSALLRETDVDGGGTTDVVRAEERYAQRGGKAHTGYPGGRGGSTTGPVSPWFLGWQSP